ncbi:MAG: hypothetical protein ACF8QF_07170 [Phycisphaerales bacterium]
MRPTPDSPAARLEQSLDAWGRAAGHGAEASMPTPLAGAVTARRRMRAVQRAGAVGSIAIVALVVGAMLFPAQQAPSVVDTDRPSRAGAASARLFDLQRANPALDPDDLRLPETSFGGVRESLGLRPYEPVGPPPDAQSLDAQEQRAEEEPPTPR